MGADRDRRLADLEQRIRSARQAGTPERRSHAAEKYNAASIAWRMVLELVLGVLIGAAVGWGIDWLAGTLPVFLIIFCLLGFAAGVRTMMRSADEVNRKVAREKAEAAARTTGEDAPKG